MADSDPSSGPDPVAEPRFIPPRDGFVVLGLQLLLLMFRIGDVPLLGPDEPRYARVAVEMARADEFVTPTLAGEPWLEKPPLYYWLAGLAYRLFGETEMAARLPAVGAALLMTGLTGLVGARLFGASCGRTAMIIMATSPLAFAYARAATMDVLVASLVTGASGLLLLSILGITGPSAVPAAWVLMGLAVLAKGPIGVLIPLGVAIAVTLALGRPAIGRIVSPSGLALLALVAGPWFLAIYADQGFHFIEVFILNHNLARFTSTVHNHPGPVYYYLPVLLLGVFPWTGLAVPAFGSLRASARREWIPLLGWILVPLAIFSVAGSKLPGYILPCLPPFAIGIAFSVRAMRAPNHPGLQRAAGLIGLIIAAALLAFTVRAAREGEPWGRSALPPAIWALVAAFMASRAFERGQRETLRILSIGAAGFLLLLSLVAPPVLEAMESGRRLFLPAGGREVLVAGAWRTAWMSGYFYNDGQVREMPSLDRALELVREEPRLVLLGPSQWQDARRMSEFNALDLAEGPRGTVLARLSLRATP